MVRSEMEGDIWLIPAARYKTDLDFEVPLSGAARAVLAKVTNLGGKAGFVFTINGSALSLARLILPAKDGRCKKGGVVSY
jgi:hypothetical protein